MRGSFETLSLHSAGPPLSLSNGGAEARFEGREDQPRLRRGRPGQDTCRCDTREVHGQALNASSWRTEHSATEADRVTYNFSGNV